MALAHKAAAGERVSRRAPYGFGFSADGQRIEPNPAEASMVQRAQKLRAVGKSLRAIARDLEAQGFKSRAGKPFAAQQIACMLRRAA